METSGTEFSSCCSCSAYSISTPKFANIFSSCSWIFHENPLSISLTVLYRSSVLLFTTLFQLDDRKTEIVKAALCTISLMSQLSHASIYLWTANQIVDTITTCRISNQTNSLSLAHCFATCSQAKQRTFLRDYNLSAMSAAHAFSNAVYGTVSYTS